MVSKICAGTYNVDVLKAYTKYSATRLIHSMLIRCGSNLFVSEFIHEPETSACIRLPNKRLKKRIGN